MNKKISIVGKSNILRAAVMGANDGLISIGALAVGVANSNMNKFNIEIAIISAILAGMISMAIGELISVSAESNAEHKIIANSTAEYKNNKEKVVDFLIEKYMQKGLSKHLASLLVTDLLKTQAVRTYIQIKYGFDMNDTVNPIFAAIASFIAFPIAGSIPLLSVLFNFGINRLIVIFTTVLVSLIIIGYLAAKVSGYNTSKVIGRNLIFGSFSMLITCLIGGLI